MLSRAVTICLVLIAAFEPVSAAVPAEPDTFATSGMIERTTEPHVSAEEGVLTLKAAPDTAEIFHIYGITGQLVKKTEVRGDDSVQLELKRGLYIVKCSRWARKIMVK